MRLNYFENDRESFESWMIITLVTQARKDGQFNQLNTLTKKWTEVDLTVQINGVEVSPENFLEGVKSNMHFWAEQKAETKAHEVLDSVREKVDEIDDLLTEVADELKRKIDIMLKS